MSIVVVSHDLSLTLGYAKKVLYVNKNAVIHEIPDFKLDVSGHICEVDLLTHFTTQAQLQKEAIQNLGQL